MFQGKGKILLLSAERRSKGSKEGALQSHLSR